MVRNKTSRKALPRARSGVQNADSLGRNSVKADAASLNKGTKVDWTHGAAKAFGKVLQVFRAKVTQRIKGAVITRNATPEKPAALVLSDRGGKALKSASELKRVSRVRRTKKT